MRHPMQKSLETRVGWFGCWLRLFLHEFPGFLPPKGVLDCMLQKPVKGGVCWPRGRKRLTLVHRFSTHMMIVHGSIVGVLKRRTIERLLQIAV